MPHLPHLYIISFSLSVNVVMKWMDGEKIGQLHEEAWLSPEKNQVNGIGATLRSMAASFISPRMYKVLMKEASWGAISPGSHWSIPTIRAEFLCFTGKMDLGYFRWKTSTDLRRQRGKA